MLMAKHLDIPVINAGDGMHEHPSQALLDALTLIRHKKKLDGIRFAIVGDIYHSRVARSMIHLLSKFGAHINLCGPPELLPEVARTLGRGVQIVTSVEDALLMHPGPIIRGLELTSEVADGPQSVIVDEVRNGVSMRMAILANAVGNAR
jgi:aspartate carbamoyltransferase catalytic subunit